MKSIRNYSIAISISLILKILQTTGIAQEIENPGSAIMERSPIMAVLPFANFTLSDKMKTIIEPLIYSRLHELGWDVITSEDLRNTLRKYRIRSRGGISVSDASTIGEELQVDFLMNGSYDIFIDQDIPEAAFSMRVIDIKDMELVLAISVASSGEDYTGLFGIGRIKSMDRLLTRLVEEAFDKFERSSLYERTGCKSDSPIESYAIVPFDNISANQNAGDIITSIFLSELTSICVDVREPGVVYNIFKVNNRLPRGEVDQPLLTQLREELGIDFIITGTVENFKPGRADVDGSSPEIELGGRLIDARTGRIISAYNRSRRGSDTETVFKLGSCYSLGKLSQDVIRSLIRDFVSDVRNSLAASK